MADNNFIFSDSEGTSPTTGGKLKHKNGNSLKKDKISEKYGEWSDSQVRTSRKFREMADTSEGGPSLAEQAKWEGKARIAKSRTYKVTLVGHSPSGMEGTPYRLNEAVRVQDVFCGLDEVMIITEVEFAYSVEAGSLTVLTLMSAEDFKASIEKSSIKDHGGKEASVKGGKKKTKLKQGDVLKEVDGSLVIIDENTLQAR